MEFVCFLLLLHRVLRNVTLESLHHAVKGMRDVEIEIFVVIFLPLSVASCCAFI
jgi:hypothetical protein